MLDRFAVVNGVLRLCPLVLGLRAGYGCAMEPARITSLATFVVVITGSLWGFYWLPVREIDALGLTGAWGTVAIVGVATLLLSPLGWRGRAALMASSWVALASVALGGFAFLLYSVGFLYGRVAVIVILFFLTPVWSTLIGRYLMGWPITRLRIFVLVLGLVGLGMMLGADGAVPVPRSLGEWLGLASGFLWAVSTIGMRVKATAGPGETAFVFAAGAFCGGLVLAPLLEPLPDLSVIACPWAVAGWVLVASSLWWAGSMTGLMWAATKLEPARVGILLMAEVFIASVSAAVIAGETLTLPELVGGGLVLIAGVVEIWPDLRRGGKISRKAD